MTSDPGSIHEISVRQVLIVFWRRKFLTAFTILLTLGLSITAIANLTPRYTAEVLLVLDVPQSRVGESQGNPDYMAGRDTLVTRTQVDILQSPALAAEVVRSLSLTLDPEFNPFIRGPSFWTTFLQTPLEQAAAYVDRSLGAKWSKAVRQPLDYATYVIGLVTEDAKSASAEQQEYRVVVEFMRRLAVENDGKSYTLRVSFTSTDAGKAARIMNRLAEAYIESQVQAKHHAAARAADWLARKLVELRGKQRAAEKAVQEFREKYPVAEVVSGGAPAPLASIEMLNLSRDLTEARAARAKADSEARDARILAQTGGGAVSSTSTHIAASVQALRTRLHSLEQQDADLSTKLGAKHPTVKGIQAEIATTNAAVNREMARVVGALEAQARIERNRESAIERKMASLAGDYQNTNRSTIELRHLEDESAAARSVLNAFLTESLKTSAQIEIQQPDARVVARADPPQFPSFPNKRVLMGTGLVAAVVLSILVVVIVESMDRGLRRIEEIEQLFGLPVLGIIPALSRRRGPRLAPVRALQNPRSLFSESVRSVGALIQVTGSRRDKKVILVTSSAPQEGKSSLASSFARISARSAQRVLLIECDLRHPSLAQHFDLAPGPGLTEILEGSCEPQEAIRFDALSNVSIIAAGDTQAAAAVGIYDSDRFKRLLAWARNHHDLIVLDSPPLGVVNDALLLAKLSDSIIFAVRWGATSRALVAATLRKLGRVKPAAVGIVLTRVDLAAYARYEGERNAYGHLRSYVNG